MKDKNDVDSNILGRLLFVILVIPSGFLSVPYLLFWELLGHFIIYGNIHPRMRDYRYDHPLGLSHLLYKRLIKDEGDYKTTPSYY